MSSQSHSVELPPAEGGEGAAEPQEALDPDPPSRPAADGFVLVDKPLGWTSHQVVGRLRRRLEIRKIGHAGTLDPLATGLLVCGVGRATRLLGYIQSEDKTYAARLRFGVETTTEDLGGQIADARGAARLTAQDVLEAAQGFLGEIEQVPSAVSAIKVDGRRAYSMVRTGETPQLKPRLVRISRLDFGEGQARVLSRAQLESTATGGAGQDGQGRKSRRRTPHPVANRAAPRSDGPVVTPVAAFEPAYGQAALGPAEPGVPVFDIDLVVDCSAGTYIRALARDLGRAVGTGAHLIALRRLRTGPFDVSEAQLGQRQVKAGPVVPVLPVTAVMSRVLPLVRVEGDLVRRVGHGQPVPLSLGGPTLLVGPGDAALAVYAPAGDQARPQTVVVGGPT